MARRTSWLVGLVMVVLGNTGCCRWCEHWCGPHQQQCAPVAYAPAPQACVPCVPCCPTAPAPAQFQRAPAYCP